ncbi:MAG: helix-turn-helix domain-containing protein [Eubacterium sp.]|nr:helix-turn-helix domain-containing protein [Eubacterium sp.]
MSYMEQNLQDQTKMISPQEALIAMHCNELYQTLNHSRGLKEIAAKAEEFLQHPLSILDASYNIIQASPSMLRIPYGLERTQSRTFLTASEVASLKRLQIEDEIYKSSRAFLSVSEDHPDTNWVYCAIRIQNVMAGYVAVCMEAPIEATEYQLRITTALADVCAIEMQKHDFFVTRTGMKYENFLIDLLEGKFNDVNLISSRLELLDRKFGKFFCIVVFSCNEPHDSNIFNQRQMSVLRQMYPNSMSVVYQDAVVLFINQETPVELTEEFTKPMEDFASRNRMKASISQPFADILRIKFYYEQAKNALELGERMNPDERLYFAMNLLPQYLFSNADYIGLEVGIHHHLHQLNDYDTENHTEFIPTLRAYLKHDRNATQTAEALHIHRSTFFYRVKKIEEILGISIADSELLFLYELSFKIWDYLSLR